MGAMDKSPAGPYGIVRCVGNGSGVNGKKFARQGNGNFSLTFIYSLVMTLPGA
ncbi:hypothetical protein HMPREF0758_1587 [Serratia odorifera DSM 4582]|uniref:Uncharacterized protein n=1 Tax=Serratia odorifera DSM 4582 TaxID=667129 RepID=D4E087_SEROD|nr:hypothetical protein HMPREF0758_1587 [Serratia odorifera DSM 4582]